MTDIRIDSAALTAGLAERDAEVRNATAQAMADAMGPALADYLRARDQLIADATVKALLDAGYLATDPETEGS